MSLMPKKSINKLFIKDIVLAGNDGLITTFAIVAGSMGASFSTATVIVLGFANLFADGLSMSTGTYLGTKSEEFSKNPENCGTLPLKAGLVSFAAFSIAGLFPLIPFIFSLPQPFLLSGILVFLSLSVIGVFRGIVSKQNILRTTLENLLIGGLATTVAFLVGGILEGYLEG